MLKFNCLAVSFGALMMSEAWAQETSANDIEEAEARLEWRSMITAR